MAIAMITKGSVRTWMTSIADRPRGTVVLRARLYLKVDHSQHIPAGMWFRVMRSAAASVPTRTSSSLGPIDHGPRTTNPPLGEWKRSRVIRGPAGGPKGVSRGPVPPAGCTEARHVRHGLQPDVREGPEAHGLQGPHVSEGPRAVKGKAPPDRGAGPGLRAVPEGRPPRGPVNGGRRLPRSSGPAPARVPRRLTGGRPDPGVMGVQLVRGPAVAFRGRVPRGHAEGPRGAMELRGVVGPSPGDVRRDPVSPPPSLRAARALLRVVRGRPPGPRVPRPRRANGLRLRDLWEPPRPPRRGSARPQGVPEARGLVPPRGPPVGPGDGGRWRGGAPRPPPTPPPPGLAAGFRRGDRL